MKVLLLGHACSPIRGTEHAVTWNWAWHLARKHEVWVFTHPQERRAIESFLVEHPASNLHFVWVSLPEWMDPWDPARGLRWIRLHYIMWQRAALREALRLHREIGFDVAHHVSWGTISEPPLLSRMPIPFVWGPVGGGQIAPSGLKAYLGESWKEELLRTLRVRLASYRPELLKAVRRSGLVLTTNNETARILRRVGPQNVQLFLDSGIRDDFLAPEPPHRKNSSLIRLLWAGTLCPRKCLPLAFDALARLGDLPLRLVVAGKGPLHKEWETLADRMGLGQRVHFLGQVPFRQMPALYRSSDIFLFTSIQDSFGSQVLEAMGAGLPIVTLNHQGVGAFVPDSAGFKAPVTNPEETVMRLAQAIRMLAGSAELRNCMGEASWRFARSQTWDRRADLMGQFYENAVRGEGRGAAKGASLDPSPSDFAD